MPVSVGALFIAAGLSAMLVGGAWGAKKVVHGVKWVGHEVTKVVPHHKKKQTQPAVK